MRILGIESSSTVASIAIMEEEILLCEYTINNTSQHSKTLMPMLEEVTNRVGIDISTINLIAVSEGPGSFTGLRIGSATAKGLAHGLGIPIASVPSLEVLAASVMIPNVLVHVIVHARANEVYYAQYTNSIQENRLITQCVQEIRAMEIEDLVDYLGSLVISDSDNNNPLSETSQSILARTVECPNVLIGDGVKQFEEQLSKVSSLMIKMPEHITFSAKTVALLGIQRYYKGDVVTYYEQKPYYHKKSQAEREYDEKNAHD